MTQNLPQVAFQLQNIKTGQWMPLTAGLDLGSDVTNLPDSYASQLGVDLYREAPIPVGTVGGDITGYLVNMEMQVKGLTFSAPIVFRSSNTPPLVGRYPLLQYFEERSFGETTVLMPMAANTMINLKMLSLNMTTRMMGSG